MKDPANKILDRRGGKPRTGWAIIVALIGHAVVALTAILAPLLAEHNREPIEFQAVTIVPVQALGVPDPEPRQPERQAPPEPERTPPPETKPPAPAAASPSASKPATTERRRAPEPAPVRPQQRRGSPLGSDIASSPFGAAGVGLDNPDFTYGYYVDQMLSMIGGAWAPPRVSGKIETIVHFRIARDGAVTELSLAKSSGNRAFDDAALRAVQNAAPLPPLPASFLSDSLGVNLIVR